MVALVNKDMKNMMQGAFILTLASFVAKILSAIYRVPYQNLAGDVGFYVYQQVYPIYGLAMTLALSGLPQFISKYVAERNSIKDEATALKELFPIISSLGIFLWAMVFFMSPMLASLMGDQQLTPLIQVVSFTFLLMPYLSITRGGFQGRLQMVPTAISQVVEQIVRVSIILAAAWCFQKYAWDVYQTGVFAMLGAVFGGICGCLILAYYQRKLNSHAIGFKKATAPWQLIKRMTIEGGLMTVYSGFLILFQLIDSFTVKKALVDHGLTDYAAQVAKGIYDRGQPLVQLGLVVALALSASFLPLLTKYLSGEEKNKFKQTSGTFLRLTCGIAAAASLGLALLLPYVNYTLFKDYHGNLTLVIFVFAIFLMAMIQAYQSIAQAQNSYRSSFQAAGIGLVIKLLTTIWLTKLWGNAGASLATLLGLLAALLFLQKKSALGNLKYLNQQGFLRHLIYCLLLMAASLFGYYGVLQILFGQVESRLATLIICLIGVMLGGGTFVFAAIRLHLLSIREWLMLPFGKKILRLRLRK